MPQLPTVEIVIGPAGEPVYRVEALGMACQHRQLWQAELMLEQMAAAEGVELPEGWLQSPLGQRCHPTMRDLDAGRLAEPGL